MAAVALENNGAQRKSLGGPQKVAALLLAMGKPLASRLLKHFDPTELKQITRSAADLGSIPTPTVEYLVEEFASQFAVAAELQGTAAEVEKLLTGVLPSEQISDIMAEVLGNPNMSTWEDLNGVPDAILANHLTQEHPQTAAVILSRVNSGCAARIMGQLSRDLRNALMRRMLSIQPIAETTVRLLERALHDALLVNVAQRKGPDPNARIADILNKLEREQIDDVLQSLAELRPKEAATLKSLLFNFEDIVQLPAKSRMIIFEKVPTDRVILALKGADGPLREAALSSLASRARRMVENELNNGDEGVPKEVAKARRAIADIVLELAQKGEIELTSELVEEA
jgi:flagellar motor switch protein FliG